MANNLTDAAGTSLETIESLGKRVTEFSKLETFPAPLTLREVTLSCDELTGICPVTGQPDLYTVEVVYVPRILCVESKTVKLYFQSFRNQGIFCESLAAKIAKDFLAALNPYEVRVKLIQKPRGGVSITSIAGLRAYDED